MRKFQIVLVILALSAVIFAAGPKNFGDVKQPVMPQRPIGGRSGPSLEQPFMFKTPFFGFDSGFIKWIFTKLPDVEIKTQVKSIEIIDGELFITVEASNEEYEIYIPAVMVKFLKLTAKKGDKIAVKGKKIVLKQGIMVIPGRLKINGKDYNIKELMQKFEKLMILKKDFLMKQKNMPSNYPIKMPEKP